jgi:hypothetical protein
LAPVFKLSVRPARQASDSNHQSEEDSTRFTHEHTPPLFSSERNRPKQG